MSEAREYVSRSEELGNIHISEEVLGVIAAAAVNEVEGVGGLVAHHGVDFAELLGIKSQSKGIHLEVSEGAITVTVGILVNFGSAIPEVAKGVQEAVVNSIEATSGLTVSAVHVNVSGIVFDKDAKKA